MWRERVEVALHATAPIAREGRGVELIEEPEVSAGLAARVVAKLSEREMCERELESSEMGAALRDELSKLQPAFDGAAWLGFFNAIAHDDEFKKSVWQKRPVVLREKLQFLQQFFTMSDLERAIETDFLQAVRGAVPSSKSGWFMKDVGEPRGDSFEDARMRIEDVQAALARGTVVFNSAGGNIPALAAVCLAAQDAFRFPANINMYITASGMEISAPPHTDKQDVFVLQTQGAKRWRVFCPPAPSAKPSADPFTRGKGPDALTMQELKSLKYLDVVLKPGEALYIPAGWPHTTDTAADATEAAASEPSLHLTVGVDTLVWGLSRDFAVRAIRRRRVECTAENDAALLASVRELSASEFFAKHRSAALGFLAGSGESNSLASTDSTISDQEEHEIMEKLASHCETIRHRLRDMYYDTVRGTYFVPSGAPKCTYFHVQACMQRINADMEAFIAWCNGISPADAPQASALGSGAKGSGFGGAVGASKKKVAAVGARKKKSKR